MTDRKLTPRVGDRVIIKSPAYGGGKTHVGTISFQLDNTDRMWAVKVDGTKDGLWPVHEDYLTVVDRESVEWPEGWSQNSRYLVDVMPPNGDNFDGTQLSRRDLEYIVETGPDMLERWDELMDDDA